MKSATATSPSRQETIQPTATRESESRNPESRNPQSGVRPIGEGSDSKQNASPASSTPKPQPVVSQAPDEEQIRRRAYELYVEGGYSDGNQDEHWFAAEREFSGKHK